MDECSAGCNQIFASGDDGDKTQSEPVRQWIFWYNSNCVLTSLQYQIKVKRQCLRVSFFSPKHLLGFHALNSSVVEVTFIKQAHKFSIPRLLLIKMC